MTGRTFHRWLRTVRCAFLGVGCAALLLATGTPAPNALYAQSPGPNLLKNPRFDWPGQSNGDLCELGAAKDNVITPHDWMPFWTCKTGEEKNQDVINRAPEYRVMTVDIASDRVRSFPTSASFFTYRSINRSAGLYQIVTNITPGSRLRFSVWANLLTTNSDILPLNSSRQPGGLQVRACLHTTGNIGMIPNVNDPAMVCGPWSRPYDTWGEVAVEATAAASSVAVVIDTTAEYAVLHNDVHLDDAELVVIGGNVAPALAPSPPQPSAVQSPGAATGGASGGTSGVPGVIVKTPTANVRAAPSYSGAIIASAPQGTTFVVRAYTPDRQWWQIEFSGGQNGLAYIHNSVVTLNAAAQAALGISGSATTAPAQPASPAQSIVGATAQVVVNTGGGRLNVRATPATNGVILGRVQNGANLEVKGISADKQWWRIAYAGGADGTAWVMAQYVIPNAAALQLAAGN